MWDRLRQSSEGARELNIDPAELFERMNRLASVYDSASDRPSQIAKTKLRGLSEPLGWNAPDICRVVARLEAGRRESDIQPLVEGLANALLQWRAN